MKSIKMKSLTGTVAVLAAMATPAFAHPGHTDPHTEVGTLIAVAGGVLLAGIAIWKQREQ